MATLINTTTRPRHATQPDNELLPATMEMDDEGNPSFFYSENTPRKGSPKIVTPRSVLDRLALTRAGSSSHHHRPPMNKVPAKPLQVENEQQRQQQQQNIVSLHDSMVKDHQKLDIYQDDEDENQSLTSRGSLRMKLKLRLKGQKNKGEKKKSSKHNGADQKSKEERTATTPLSPLSLSRHNKTMATKAELLPPPKKLAFHRRSSRAGTESTRSLSSRGGFSVADGLVQEPRYSSSSSISSFKAQDRVFGAALMQERVEMNTRGAPLSVQIPAMIEGTATGQITPMAPETPPALASLKSAMASAGAGLSNNNDKARAAETPPALASLKSAMDSHNKARQAIVPALQQQRPKTRNLVSAIKPSSTRASSTKVSTDEPSVASRSSRRPSSTKSVVSSSTSVCSTTSSNHPGNKDFKVFLLLLHPSSKIFELIQLYFNPTTTTIRGVINMIPANATEPALGAQDYTGLCRSSDDEVEEQEIADLDLLVQNHDNMKNSAQVARGEILVAIPIGYSAKKIAKLSQQILVNPRICRLLEKSNDPTAPKQTRKKKSSRSSKDGRRRRCSARSSSSRKVSVKVVEDNGSPGGMPSPTMSVQHAMEKAESAAAAANAAVHELHLPNHRGKSLLAAAGKQYRYPQGRRNSESGIGRHPSTPGTDCSMSVESALRSMDSSVATKTECSFTDASDASFSMKSYDNQSFDQSSVGESYSTWSKSLDTSFAGGGGMVYSARAATPLVAASVSVENVAPTRRRKRQMKLIRRVTVCVVAVMTVPYFLDTNGFAMRNIRVDNVLQLPFGMAGLIQFFCVFLVLVKLQYLCTIPPSQSSRAVAKCPFMKLRASMLAAHSQNQNRR